MTGSSNFIALLRDQLLVELNYQHWGLVPGLIGGSWLVCQGQASPQGAALAVCAALVASYDLVTLRIPNLLNAIIAAVGLILALAHGGMVSLGAAALAGFICFAILSLFFFFGCVGAGDVKAIAALAVIAGSPWQAFELFVWCSLCGGAIALIRLIWLYGISFWRCDGLWRVMRLQKKPMPYGLAIWCGAMLFLLIGG